MGQMIGYVHTKDTVIAIEERLTDFIEMKEKLGYSPTRDQLCDKEQGWQGNTRLVKSAMVPPKVITPNGFPQHRRCPQLVQMKCPKICIFHPDRS